MYGRHKAGGYVDFFAARLATPSRIAIIIYRRVCNPTSLSAMRISTLTPCA